MTTDRSEHAGGCCTPRDGRTVCDLSPAPAATGTVIREVFGRAYERGDRPALIDLHGGLVYGYRKLVTEVTVAASGLVRRGARRDQVVGVLVSTACAQTLAVHTVLAAGGVAAPVDPRLPPEQVADLLNGWDARMLITTPDLAESAVRAADLSRVRQVLSFGDALDTIDFADLFGLEPAPLPSIDPYTQQAVVTAGGVPLTHRSVLARMMELDLPARLTEADVLLVTWPPDGGYDLVALIGLAVGRGALVVAAHGLGLADLPATVHDFGITVTAMPDGSIERL